MQFLILPKEKFNLFMETTKCNLICLGCVMRDYQKGLALRVTPGTAVQHSDTNLLQTVSPGGQFQLRESSSSLLLFETRPGRGCTSHSWGTPSRGSGRDRLLLCSSVATRTLCCMWSGGLWYKLLGLDCRDKMLPRSQDFFRREKPLRSISVFSFPVSVFCWWDLT